MKNFIPTSTKAIGIESKILFYIPKFLLKTIYYSILNPYLIYACQACGQNDHEKLSCLHNKTIRIINFKQQYFPVNELYNANEIPKLKDYIHLINFVFVKDVQTDKFHGHLHDTYQDTPSSLDIQILSNMVYSLS